MRASARGVERHRRTTAACGNRRRAGVRRTGRGGVRVRHWVVFAVRGPRRGRNGAASEPGLRPAGLGAEVSRDQRRMLLRRSGTSRGVHTGSAQRARFRRRASREPSHRAKSVRAGECWPWRERAHRGDGQQQRSPRQQLGRAPQRPDQPRPVGADLRAHVPGAVRARRVPGFLHRVHRTGQGRRREREGVGAVPVDAARRFLRDPHGHADDAASSDRQLARRGALRTGRRRQRVGASAHHLPRHDAFTWRHLPQGGSHAIGACDHGGRVGGSAGNSRRSDCRVDRFWTTTAT